MSNKFNFATLTTRSNVHSVEEKIKRKVFVRGLEVIRPRPMQKRLLAAIKTSSSRHVFLQASVAAGKTIAAKLLSVSTLKLKNQRMLVVVPMKSIGMGHSDNMNIRIGNISYDHITKASINFTHDDHRGSKYDLFIQWLKKPKALCFLDGDVCGIVTNAAIQRLHLEGKMHLLKNFFINIDEAHHNAHDGDNGNQLGSALNELLKNDNKWNVTLMLTSGSPMRSDTFKLMDSKHTDKFEVFQYTALEMFDDAKDLKGFDWKFYADESDWVDIVRQNRRELLEPDDKIIISMPSINRKISIAKTISERGINVTGLLTALGCKNKDIKWDTNTGFAIVKLGRKNYRILNLTDPNHYSGGLQYIKDNPNGVDILINVNVFAEGADWPQANKTIIIGERNSMTQLIQTIGRIFRDCIEKKDKPIAKVIQILPNIDMESTERDSFNAILKAVSMTLVYIQTEMPRDWVIINNPNEETRPQRFNHIRSIIEQLGDDCTQELLDIQIGIGKIIYDVESNEYESEAEKSREKISAISDMLTNEFGITRDVERIATTYILLDKQIQLGGVTEPGMDVSDLDYNMLSDGKVRSIYMGGMKPKEFIVWYREVFERDRLTTISNTVRLISFTKKHNRNPSCKSKDITEQKLGAWHVRMKKSRKDDDHRWLPELQDMAVDAGIPELFDYIDKEQKQLDNLESYISFTKKHNRKPTPSDSSGVEEKRLYKWLSHTKSAKQKKMNGGNSSDGYYYESVGKRAAEAGFPDLFDIVDGFTRTMNITREIIEYYKTNNKLPCDNPTLGGFMVKARLKKQHIKGIYYPESEQLLIDADIPSFYEMDVPEIYAILNTKELIKFYEDKGRLPTTSKHVTDKEERRIASFMYKTRRARLGYEGKFYKSCLELVRVAGIGDVFKPQLNRKQQHEIK